MWNFLKPLLILLGLIIGYIIFAYTIGFIDEMITERKNRKKRITKGIPLSSWLKSKSRRCLICGSARISVEPNQQLLNVWKKEQSKIKGLKCYIKLCHDCGHIDFFSTPILGNSIKKLYHQPLWLMPINLLWTGAKDFAKTFGSIFSIFKLK